MSVQLQFSKGGSVTINRLADATVPTVELHGAFDPERGRVGIVCRNTDEHQPLLVSTAAVVDYLRPGKTLMSIEQFLRGRRHICHGPVIDGSFCHYPDGIFRYPLPESDVLGMHVGLDLGLGNHVKYLHCPTSCTRNTVNVVMSNQNITHSTHI